MKRGKLLAAIPAMLLGQGATILNGNWFLAAFKKAVGGNLGAFVPPCSVRPLHSVVDFSGDGFAVTKYSKHKAQAIAFLQF